MLNSRPWSQLLPGDMTTTPSSSWYEDWKTFIPRQINWLFVSRITKIYVPDLCLFCDRHRIVNWSLHAWKPSNSWSLKSCPSPKAWKYLRPFYNLIALRNFRSFRQWFVDDIFWCAFDNFLILFDHVSCLSTPLCGMLVVRVGPQMITSKCSLHNELN